MAKKPSKAEAELLERRNRQLAELDQVVEALIKKVGDLHQKEQKVNLLQSVSLGLYDEMDKMAKKAGADQVTDLALEQVNEFIRDARALMAEDVYVQRQKEFVAAGDNPQYRDVVVVMRQLRQGLERLNASVAPQLARWNEALADAKGVRVAVQLILEDSEAVSKNELKEREVSAKPRWWTKDESYTDQVFSFEVLDRTDIPNYFTAAQ
jgi:hypothetical protein